MVDKRLATDNPTRHPTVRKLPYNILLPRIVIFILGCLQESIVIPIARRQRNPIDYSLGPAPPF